jgi:hypothetical protein
VLGALPPGDVDGLDLVVLRQPTRKGEIFSSAWGRIHWCVDFRGYSGPAITLDAIDVTQPWMPWGDRSLTPEWQRELIRLRRLGVNVQETGRGYLIEVRLEQLRRWVLSRTVPHEVGHWIDFRRSVMNPLGIRIASEAIDHPGYKDLLDRWYGRPHRQREEFADRYADEVERVVVGQIDNIRLSDGASNGAG